MRVTAARTHSTASENDFPCAAAAISAFEGMQPVRALAAEGTLADQHHAGTAPGGLSGRFDWPAGF